MRPQYSGADGVGHQHGKSRRTTQSSGAGGSGHQRLLNDQYLQNILQQNY